MLPDRARAFGTSRSFGQRPARDRFVTNGAVWPSAQRRQAAHGQTQPRARPTPAGYSHGAQHRQTRRIRERGRDMIVIAGDVAAPAASLFVARQPSAPAPPGRVLRRRRTFAGSLRVEPAGIEPATSCLQRGRDADQLAVNWRFSPKVMALLSLEAVDRVAARSRPLRLPSGFHPSTQPVR